MNLEKFEWLDHQDLASILIDKWFCDSVAKNLEKFEWLLNKEIAEKLIMFWEWDSVIKSLEKFIWIESILLYIKYFSKINVNIYNKYKWLYEKNNSDAIKAFASEINELKSDVKSGLKIFYNVDWITWNDIQSLVYN